MKTSVISALLFSASGALAFDFLVGVGKDERTGQKGMGFDPSSIHPSAGDTIVFEFRSGDHSAVQSSFANPCAGIEGGFNSGVQTVADDLHVDAPGLPQVRLVVNDTEPLWFFDQAGGLCGAGGVLSVNPTQEQSAAAFVENAKNSPDAPPPPPPSDDDNDNNTGSGNGNNGGDNNSGNGNGNGNGGSNTPNPDENTDGNGDSNTPNPDENTDGNETESPGSEGAASRVVAGVAWVAAMVPFLAML